MSVTAPAETPAIRSLLRRPSLTAERERHLLRQCRAGGEAKARQQALAELWDSHSRLVVAVVRQFRRPDLAMTDLLAAGQRGLHGAIDGFDPDRSDVRLSSYAVRWIRHSIQEHIRQHAEPVRAAGSRAHRQLLLATGRLFADAHRACRREGIAASDSELCARVGARVGLSGDEVAECLNLARNDVLYFDAPGQDARSMLRPLVPQSAAPEAATIHRLDHAKLRRRILSLAGEILGERERAVFVARCMADADGATQPDSLAAELGVTRERVQQLEASARRKITVALAKDGLLHASSGGLELPKRHASRRTPRRLLETQG